MHQNAPPPESFLNKSVRLVHQGVETMGTIKGAYEGLRALYGGAQAAAAYARPLMALM